MTNAAREILKKQAAVCAELSYGWGTMGSNILKFRDAADRGDDEGANVINDDIIVTSEGLSCLTDKYESLQDDFASAV